MTRTLDKARATSFTRLAQIGFGVMVCAAVATAYLGLPRTQPPSENDFVVTGSDPIDPVKDAEKPRTDAASSAFRLSLVANAPKPVPVAAADPNTKPNDSKTPEPVVAGDMKYLGFANVGSVKMALMVVRGKQRFVREGQLLDGERVQSIDPDFVTLTTADAQRKIPLEERSGDRVTRLKSGPTDAGRGMTAARINGVTAPRPINGDGVRGLSKLPDGYEKWPPAYQRLFDRQVNQLLQTGEFPDEMSVIEKARGHLEGEGYRPEDPGSIQKLEEMEKHDAASQGVEPKERN